jgi:tetratricopeptide (TPR) repeat protein
MEDMRRVRANQHLLDGYVGLLGRGVIPGARPDDATILDIAPTLLALAGLPAAGDMPGRVLDEVLEIPVPARVESYSPEPRSGAPARADAEVNEQILERLKSLGYLDTTAPRGDRVLAGILFQEGKLEESLAAYRRLLAETPDDGALHSSIAGVLGRLGRYDEADSHLARALEITPLNASAWHNRGVIRERRGDPAEAVEMYRTAIRYRPDYQPAREALVRLTGSADLPVPVDPRARQADALAQQASVLARGGDYAAAMEMLDEAIALAPDYGLLYQYRANVAYLMGDPESARQALQRGLELEPDNALFRENLKRLPPPDPPGD